MPTPTVTSAQSEVRVKSAGARWDGRWLLTHEHVSQPIDVESGTAVTDLGLRPDLSGGG
jgi:hypothetical protein